ncbi:MAG: YceD family protein [Gemmatimonadaceae bacterium]
MRATGRLSKAGAGRFYWSGRIEGEAVVDCRRCLSTAEVQVADDVHLIIAEENDEDADDPDVFRIPRGVQLLDLRAAIREHWLLSVPAFALCRDECKGLCPRCGADLNAGACGCPPETDSRWESLRTVRRESE